MKGDAMLTQREVRRQVAIIKEKDVRAQGRRLDASKTLDKLSAQLKAIQKKCPHKKFLPHGKHERVMVFSTCADCGAHVEN